MKTKPAIRSNEVGNNAGDRLFARNHRKARAIPRIAALLFLGAAAGPLHAQNITQTISLHPGRNAVFLEVAPTDPTVGNVFSDPAISSVWEPRVRASTVAFIQNPNETAFNRSGWSVYVPTNQPESINNDLFAVTVNHAYVVNVSGSGRVTVNVTGRPALRALPFSPDTYTLRGFSVDPVSPPSFQTFFGPSVAHYNPATQTLQQIYWLNNLTGQWELVNPTDLMARGTAYWVYTVGGSSYMGPLTALPGVGDGLDFGVSGDEEDLTLQNNTASAMNVTITDLGTGNRPLTYYYTDTNNPVAVWLPLPQNYVKVLPAGATQQLRLSIQRSQMTNDSYATVLAVSDGLGTQFHVAVSAQRPSLSGGAGITKASAPGKTAASSIPVALQAGLWVGDVTVNGVAETYNNITNTTPTRWNFDLRLILHVTTNGTTRLLREVIQMFQNGTYTNNSSGQQVLSQPGQTVLLTDDTLLSQFTGVALRDGVPVGRRISTAGYDFDPPGGTNYLTMTGTFGIGNSVGCTITLLPTTPTNPFLHRFHPDHDNLDAFYQPLAPNVPPEVYTISRQIQLQFTPTDPTGQSAADYGYNEIGGTYSETLTGLHRNPLVVSGIFHLRQVVNTPFLNVNQ